MRKLYAAAAMIVSLAVAGCEAGGALSLPDGPLFAGVTTRVEVSCPSPMEVGQGGQCVAYGYDAQNLFTGIAATDWQSSNTSAATIDPSSGYATAVATGTTTISAKVEGVTGYTAVSVVTPLTVTLYGSDTAESGDYQCNFWASASGGTGSYTYSWYPSSNAWGWSSGSSWTGGATSNFFVKVVVTSGTLKAEDTVYVTVYPQGTPFATCVH